MNKNRNHLTKKKNTNIFQYIIKAKNNILDKKRWNGKYVKYVNHIQSLLFYFI